MRNAEQYIYPPSTPALPCPGTIISSVKWTGHKILSDTTLKPINDQPIFEWMSVMSYCKQYNLNIILSSIPSSSS